MGTDYKHWHRVHSRDAICIKVKTSYLLQTNIAPLQFMDPCSFIASDSVTISVSPGILG